jgi:hypothetical protein
MFLSVLILFDSCDDMLDVTPKNVITDEQIFGSESGIRAYFATLYSNLPVEDFRFGKSGFDKNGNQTYLANVSGEAMANANNDVSSLGDGTWWGAWDYGRVRRVNYFLQTLPKYKANYSEDQFNAWMGEACFIRAYYYFAMVKRYGGVPVLKEPQEWTGDVEVLKASRDTEKDCYDFIAGDLDLAAEYMKKGAAILNDSKYSARANEYVAYALKSRAMLYAGSIARYGRVDLDGVVGIESSFADHYFELAFLAAKKIVDSEKYFLYRKNTDKEKNFSELFLAENSPENILIKDYQLKLNAHSWDIYCIPYQYRGEGYASSLNPPLEFANLFERKDGSPANFDQLATGTKFDDPADLFKDMDARFGGSIIYPNAVFKGTNASIQKGLIRENGSKLESAVNDTIKYVSESGKTYYVVGKSGVGKFSGNMTGFIAKKYLNESMPQSEIKENYSTQHWIEFRLAEIYLNAAEAAVETGRQEYKSEALVWMNDLRDRAGLKTWDLTAMTVDNIRHERRVELAFESHAYWDLRRWRLADKMFEAKRFFGFYPYLDVRDDKYVFDTGFANGYYYTFDPKMYYERIPESERSKNNKLVQNPLYN